MYCIECGATPVRLGNWCQSCVNASASIPSTLPAVAFQPPTMKSTLPAVAIPPPTNKPNQAVMAQFSASGSQVKLEKLNSLKVISAIPSEPHLSSNPEKRDPISEDEYNGSDSSLPSGDFSTCSKVKNGTKTEKHPVDKHSNGFTDLMLPTASENLLHCFQHWVYAHTHGQMIITHFKGNAPFIAKPRVIDLNPSSHWAHGVNTKNIISDFVQKHICTQACKRLVLRSTLR
ncbi:hypothetical protein PSTT_12835, partial [Puccinia striiformis]